MRVQSSQLPWGLREMCQGKVEAGFMPTSNFFSVLMFSSVELINTMGTLIGF
jgi:hypothetical protein